MKLHRMMHILVITGLSIVSAQQGEKMRVGIIEFELQNDVGIENGGRIIAEWLASEMVRVGRFDVSERLSLGDVLAEQDLGLAGIVSDETAAAAGKIRGVQAIVTGSIMKIGSTISVTGKIIAVETGLVLKTSVVRAANLDALPHEIEVLANSLSEVSRDQFEIRLDLTKREQTYMSVGASIAPAFATNDAIDETYSAFAIGVHASVTSLKGSAWFHGYPIGDMRGIGIGGMYNITPFWGIVGEYGFMADDATDYVEVYYYILGVGIQPRHELSAKLMVIGGTTKGVIWVWDDDFEEVDGSFTFMPPLSYGVEINYRFEGPSAIMVRYISASLTDYTLTQHADPFDNFYQASQLSIIWQREFAIGR